MSVIETLSKAKADQCIVRVYRNGLEDGWVSGYVISCGKEFFVLEVFDKATRLDGFTCLRYEDVTECESPCPSQGFLVSALRLRNESGNKVVDFDAPTVARLLGNTAKNFPVVSIHLEECDPECCFIGTVVSLTAEKVGLLLITPDGEWEDEPESFVLKDITRLDFGGTYEAALVMVANEISI